ncbi:DUF1364 domain-containing protein [Chitinilyticum litopenaei]|uniref:DUF1364 domain-containing protein n=1 Tax=Chitinilyticum litopenaei TaxID=1121276 RepID=UPI001FE076C3|nr:DUF1364 domain-containing protein [Chitinilyticum litopenaei]
MSAPSKIVPRPAWQQACSAKGIAVQASKTATHKAIPKTMPRKSSTWLSAVHAIENCVLCGRYGVQAAHRNEGKGRGQKTDDALAAAICSECHHEIDNGKQLDREQRRALMDRAIVLTLRELFRRGLIECKEGSQ